MPQYVMPHGSPPQSTGIGGNCGPLGSALLVPQVAPPLINVSSEIGFVSGMPLQAPTAPILMVNTESTTVPHVAFGSGQEPSSSSTGDLHAAG